jgi:hypothetical protein
MVFRCPPNASFRGDFTLATEIPLALCSVYRIRNYGKPKQESSFRHTGNRHPPEMPPKRGFHLCQRATTRWLFGLPHQELRETETREQFQAHRQPSPPKMLVSEGGHLRQMSYAFYPRPRMSARNMTAAITVGARLTQRKNPPPNGEGEGRRGPLPGEPVLEWVTGEPV